MEVNRVWVVLLGVWGASAQAHETFSLPIWEGGRARPGTCTVLPPSKGVFENVDRLPGQAPYLLSQGVGLVVRELEQRRHSRSADLRWGPREARVQLSDEDLILLRESAHSSSWLVPDSAEGHWNHFGYYEGPLKLARLRSLRYQPSDSVSGGTLEGDFGESYPYWLSSTNVAPSIRILEYQSFPLVFAGAGLEWRQMEAVEIIELRPANALVVSRRQIDKAFPGDRVELRQVPSEYSSVQRPGLWWLRPQTEIPGRVAASYTMQRGGGGGGAATLAEIREWHGGLRPRAHSLWSSCASRLASAKDRFFDELAPYLGAAR